MSLHNIEFEYQVDNEVIEGFLPNVEVDETLDVADQEASILFEIKSLYPDATEIDITRVEPA